MGRKGGLQGTREIEAASRPKLASWTIHYLLRCPDGETEALSQRHTQGEAESAARG